MGTYKPVVVPVMIYYAETWAANKEVGCDGNEDVDENVWSHHAGQNKERWQKYPHKCRKRKLKWYRNVLKTE